MFPLDRQIYADLGARPDRRFSTRRCRTLAASPQGMSCAWFPTGRRPCRSLVSPSVRKAEGALVHRRSPPAADSKLYGNLPTPPFQPLANDVADRLAVEHRQQGLFQYTVTVFRPPVLSPSPRVSGVRALYVTFNLKRCLCFWIDNGSPLDRYRNARRQLGMDRPLPHLLTEIQRKFRKASIGFAGH